MKKKLVLSAALFLITAACGKEPAQSPIKNIPKNYIFVIDTSGSMFFQGRTIEKVKNQIPELINLVQTGDSVTLITFDEKPVVNDPIVIQSDEDKKNLIQKIQNINAEGAYTDMSRLIETLREYAVNHPNQKSFIVVLSDGIDDPSPENKNRSPVDLKQYESEQKGPVNDYYIYYISLGRVKSENLEKGLNSVSSQVKTIEAEADTVKDGKASESADAADIGIGAVAADIKQKNILFSLQENIYALAAIAGILLIGLLFLLVNLLGKRKKLDGRLVYQTSDFNSNPITFNLGKVMGGKLVIGSKRGSNLRIIDLGIPREIVFKPGSKSGLNYLRPVGKSASLINFLGQSVKGRVSFGDKFKIGNYIFEYKNGKEN